MAQRNTIHVTITQTSLKVQTSMTSWKANKTQKKYVLNLQGIHTNKMQHICLIIRIQTEHAKNLMWLLIKAVTMCHTYWNILKTVQCECEPYSFQHRNLITTAQPTELYNIWPPYIQWSWDNITSVDFNQWQLHHYTTYCKFSLY